MMGLQAAASKRKYDVGESGEAAEQQGSCSPAKSSRWSGAGVSTTPATTTTSVISASGLGEDSIARLEAVTVPGETTWAGEPIVDSISRLQAVAVPGESTWGTDGARSALATTLLAADDLEDDDDDFEDDFDEDDTAIPSYLPLRYPCGPPRGYGPPAAYSPAAKSSYYTESYPPLTTCSRGVYGRGPAYGSAGGWSGGYYTPPEAATSPQQTIRCAENGKSYLELGSASYGSNGGLASARGGVKRCCDGRNNWCNSKQCYKERRLKMMNLSMFKLSRFRQVSEQSLYRSVLICNTLKCIEREMEMESKELGMHQHHVTNPHHHHHHHMHHPQPPPPQPPHPADYHPQYRAPAVHHAHHTPPEMHYPASPEAPGGGFQAPYNGRAATPAPPNLPFNDSLPPYDHHPLRDAAHSGGRATPFPAAGLPDTDSGYGDEDCTRPINWGSVLSLSSQSALDPLNNNDLFAGTTATSTPAATSSSTSSCSFAAATTFSFASAASCTVTATTNWDYGLLDMDLGLGPELTELLPSWKLTPLSADDILKSVPEPGQQEMDAAFTHIMVGS
ncbi:SKI/DACH domain-containing protein 1 isoform X2 [Phlebotomus papatasi]|nr:SKI/DACH domain-containing protein 1 isoform X2 [Phlebotomus papatasi]